MNTNQNTLSLTVECPDGKSKAETLSWMLRSFLCSVCESNLQGTPKRNEAMRLVLGTAAHAEIEGQISKREYGDMFTELCKIEEQIYPGCSLI